MNIHIMAPALLTMRLDIGFWGEHIHAVPLFIYRNIYFLHLSLKHILNTLQYIVLKWIYTIERNSGLEERLIGIA
jgi:hypothetical protein